MPAVRALPPQFDTQGHVALIMRKFPHWSRIVVLFALLAAGCSSENQGKIEGTKWSSVETTVGGKSLPAGARTFAFTEDGSVTCVAGENSWSGTYSLGRGQDVILKMDQTIAGRKKHIETVAIEGDRMTMTDSDGTALEFTRLPEEDAEKPQVSGDGF